MNEGQQKIATERIWRELSDRLRQFIQSRVNSAMDVDDVLQTVFLQIHQNIDSLRRAERMESWVFQITRNAIIDYFRKHRDRQDDDALALLTEKLNDDENANREVVQCVAAMIEHLPESQRRAVSMYELEGLSQAEIAQRESISLSGAKSRVQRGRQELEAMLRECCVFQFDARGNVLDYKALGNNCGRECDGANDCR